MKRSRLILFLLLALLIFLLFQFAKSVQKYRDLTIRTHKPLTAVTVPRIAQEFRKICTAPIALQIGDIDPEFGLTADEISTLVASALKEWHDATGRTWFVLKERGELTINFLFDGRQSDLVSLQAEHAMLLAEVEAAKRKPLASKAEAEDLRNRVKAFELKQEKIKKPVPWAQHHTDGGGTSIDVFAFSDREQLHATLLHELGHAIGLDHLPQPDAIMYALRVVNKSDIHLSVYDVEAALSLCEAR